MSTPSPDRASASLKANGEVKAPSGAVSSRRRAVADIAHAHSAQSLLLFLIAFRILNALSIRTFFQPDEYFQSLEPAWRMVFGEDSGAWITWEWRSALRSAIHPSLFAAAYSIAHLAAEALPLSPAARAALLLATPKTLQAVLAALGDYYTWRLAQRIFGRESRQPWATLALTVASPWQWFCSTRTLSNCMETTLTIAALYNWPWHWSLVDNTQAECDDAGLRMREEVGNETGDETTRLRRALLLAALATVMRPTNLLVWIILVAMTCLKMSRGGWVVQLPRSEQQILVDFTFPSLARATRREQIKLVTESCLCGSAILLLSLLVDRFYYRLWAFPPIKFLYFNVVQSLSVFYGTNDWHYYLSQGFPLLLTTALPFALAGIYQNVGSSNAAQASLPHLILSQLATISCLVPALLSVISHKEVRFIYPLLPVLHILAATPLTRFFGPSLRHRLRSRLTPPHALPRRILLACLLAVNATVAIYVTTVHNRGVIDALTYLRHQHETHHQQQSSNPTLTAAFLMPCHSTPWRSHLIHPDIHAWALTCEPPLHLSSAEARKSYMDEADAFYANSRLWLRSNMNGKPPTRPPRPGNDVTTHHHDQHQHHRRDWPEYLIFFSQLESTMEAALKGTGGSGYTECWRGFNSHWHDDWRRQGDVVVWCLDPAKGRVVSTQATESLTRRFLDLKDRGFGITTTAEKSSGGDVSAVDNVLAGAKGPWGIGKSTTTPSSIPPSSPSSPFFSTSHTWFESIQWPWSRPKTGNQKSPSPPPRPKKKQKRKKKKKKTKPTTRRDAWS